MINKIKRIILRRKIQMEMIMLTKENIRSYLNIVLYPTNVYINSEEVDDTGGLLYTYYGSATMMVECLPRKSGKYESVSLKLVSKDFNGIREGEGWVGYTVVFLSEDGYGKTSFPMNMSRGMADMPPSPYSFDIEYVHGYFTKD